MAFHVVALEPAEFEEWLEQEASPAQDASRQNPHEGRRLFLANGCGGCHAIRGTAADGTIGPDLTHVGSRHSIGAATLDNTPESIAAWIEGNQHIKPENRMPPYRFFTDAELAALAEYLAELR
jgi:cytochrome c oxidase subunit 2